MTIPALVDREDVRPRVDTLVADHLASTRLDAEHRHGAETGPLYDALGRMLSGGKRLRAAFAYWSWRAHGGAATSEQREGALLIGASLELFQAAALFHDDVMDNSDTRRGLATAHVHFAREHEAKGWPGDPARYGLSAAVLLGDLALVASEDVFADALAHLPQHAVGATRAIFSTMRTEVTIGQYLDVLNQVRPWSDDPVDDERRARAIIRAKSARYSVEHPLTLGAAAAGADAARIERVVRFGLPLGEAFQLRDDVLGVFGDPAVTGKPAGDDLREGKRTVLLARTFQAAGEAERALVRDALDSPELTDDDVARVRDVIVGSGALDSVERLIGDLSDQAFGALDALELDPEATTVLRALGYAAVERQS